MENGGSDLAHKFTGLGINGVNNNDSSDALFQVMKAVEAAEATIKQQVEENNRLKSELLRKHHEIEKYKMEDWTSQNPHSVDNWDGRGHGSPGIDRSNYHLANPTGGDSSLNNSSAHGPSGTLGLRKEVTRNNINPVMQDYGESRFESSKINEARNAFPSGHAELHNGAISQRSSPSTTSFSSRRYQLEGEYDRRGLMTMADIGDPGSSLKQELIVKARENDAEISQLRKHLAEYSVKEVQLRNENYILEKRIAYMRMAFDQQQQELVDAASKAISYRQDIVEENIRLSYALQEAQQERSTFVSSLVPVIAEFFSPPSVADAQSIVSNLKVIFKHLQEQLNITESKLKESQYQIAPWRSDTNFTSFAQSPSHSLLQNELDMVPQPVYSKEELAMPSGPLKDRDWDTLGDQQSILDGGVAKNLETDDFGRYSALSSRNPASQVVPEQLTVSPSDSLPRNSEMTSNKQVKFSDTVSSIELDDPDMEGQQIGRDPSANWSSRNSPYTADDHIPSYSPYLPPLLEEPSSSFSEAADDDPLPAVEGLQISGEPYPGQELQASGYSINGTTSCNFEWVRHLEDGSVNYIDGAKQPNYLVSADDVDNYLAIEVQPMDDRKRKGELVKVFANENRKIACDPEMHNIIRRNLQAGQASYRISQSVGYLDMWEPAILVVKKEGFNIKGTGSSTSLVTEKFSSATSVIVPCGQPTEFSIISGGVGHLLQAENSPDDIGGARDTIVLTLRLFILRQALAHVTAQAALSQSQSFMHIQADGQLPSLSPASAETMTYPSSSSDLVFGQQMQDAKLEPESSKIESPDISNFEKKSLSTSLSTDKPAGDGYNWRKYGQKQVKASEYPRSYYKCTYVNCPVKKKVECSPNGQVTEITYKGQHNHELPLSNKRTKSGSDRSRAVNAEAKVEPGFIGQTESSRSEEAVPYHLVPTDQLSTQLVPLQSHELITDDVTYDAEPRVDEDEYGEPDPKRRNIEVGSQELPVSHRAVTESRIVVQTRSEVDLLDDGFKWRKYGQKVVKGNQNPRSYYKCTYAGCNVRKHVERASTDPKAVITSYEGKHNHDTPTSRNSGHYSSNASANQSKPARAGTTKKPVHKDMDFEINQSPFLLQLKEV